MNSDMARTAPVPNEVPAELRAAELRALLIQSAIIIVLLLILLSMAINWWWSSKQPRIADISIADVALAGPAALCPGEPLLIEYAVHIAGAGVMERDATTWRSENPYTIINSSPSRLVIDGSIDARAVEEAWLIPVSYLNPLTGKVESLPPGRYRRTISLSSLGRNAMSSIGSVDFTIRDDC